MRSLLLIPSLIVLAGCGGGGDDLITGDNVSVEDGRATGGAPRADQAGRVATRTVHVLDPHRRGWKARDWRALARAFKEATGFTYRYDEVQTVESFLAATPPPRPRREELFDRLEALGVLK